jgi:hypothetical protein
MDELSINSASAIQQARVQDQVAIAVAKQSMDAQKQQGEAMVELIRSASPRPGQGSCSGGACDIYG